MFLLYILVVSPIILLGLQIIVTIIPFVIMSRKSAFVWRLCLVTIFIFSTISSFVYILSIYLFFEPCNLLWVQRDLHELGYLGKLALVIHAWVHQSRCECLDKLFLLLKGTTVFATHFLSLL